MLAMVAKDQRAREGKQVNALSPHLPSLAFTSAAREQRTHSEPFRVRGSGLQRAGLGVLEDTDLEVVSGVWTYTFSVALLRAILFQVPFCGDLQNVQNFRSTL